MAASCHRLLVYLFTYHHFKEVSMIEEHEASYHQADYSPNEAVAKSFACFLDGDRALIPHKNRYARWMFLHSWLVPLVLLILAILFSTAAVIGAENQQVVATMIRVYGPRYAAQDCEDDWVRIDGVYYGRLICAVTLRDGEREGQVPSYGASVSD